jgi:hypothetical protein
MLLLQEFVKCKKFTYDLVTITEGKKETLEDLVDLTVVLKFILSNYSMKAWNGYSWLRVWPSGSFLFSYLK